MNTRYRKNYNLEKRLDYEWSLIGDLIGPAIVIGGFVVFLMIPYVWLMLAYIGLLTILIITLNLPSLIRMFWTKQQRKEYGWFVSREKERRW